MTGWNFVQDDKGRVWPYNPDGKLHVPFGALMKADGGWPQARPPLEEVKAANDALGLNTIRVLSGLEGEPIGHHVGGTNTKAAPPLDLATLAAFCRNNGYMLQIMPTHGPGWGRYFEGDQLSLWRRWVAWVVATIPEDLHPWVWLQTLPEPGSYEDGLGVKKWGVSIEAARTIRKAGWRGVIQLQEHMWGQYGPINYLDRARSGILSHPEEVKALLDEDSQIVGAFESYGKAWAHGPTTDARIAHGEAYVEAVNALGLYVFCSDWDYRGGYESDHYVGPTDYTNSNPDVGYGAEMWATVARYSRKNVGLVAWSGTPHNLPGEMKLTRGDRGWLVEYEAGLTRAGSVLTLTATAERSGPLESPPEPPGAPETPSKVETTLEIIYEAPKPVAPLVKRLRPFPTVEGVVSDGTPVIVDLEGVQIPAEANVEFGVDGISIGQATIEGGQLHHLAPEGFHGSAKVTITARDV